MRLDGASAAMCGGKYEHPAVGAILAPARTQIPLTKECHASQHEHYNGKGNESQMGEEGGKTAPAENSKPERGNGTVSLRAPQGVTDSPRMFELVLANARSPMQCRLHSARM
jgi:hypothetical protein